MWGWIADRWAREHPTWEVVIGSCPPPWRKGVAVADGVSRAGGDVLVVADADSFVAPGLLLAAVESCSTWAQPHATVLRLTDAATRRLVRTGQLGNGRRHDAPACGGIVAVTREVWGVAPIDPRFAGWGGEDISWARALRTLVGPGVNLGGELVHLWHPPMVHRRVGSPETDALAARYAGAEGDRPAMAALLAEASWPR